MSAVIRTEKRQRSPLGEFVKWIFVAFNIIMLAWLISGLDAVSRIAPHSDAARVGHAVGSVIGISMVLGIWVIGDVILGLFVLLTRGDKVIVEETAGSAHVAGPSAERSLSAAQDAMIARYMQRQQDATRESARSLSANQREFGRRR
jgi:hypothetical protein